MACTGEIGGDGMEGNAGRLAASDERDLVCRLRFSPGGASKISPCVGWEAEAGAGTCSHNAVELDEVEFTEVIA